MPFDEGPPADWRDVSFGITSGWIGGYQRGHRDGHRAGWQAGLQAGALRDETFIRSLADEIRRRDLEDEQVDTTGVRQWIKNLIDSLDAKARREGRSERRSPRSTQLRLSAGNARSPSRRTESRSAALRGVLTRRHRRHRNHA